MKLLQVSTLVLLVLFSLLSTFQAHEDHPVESHDHDHSQHQRTHQHEHEHEHAAHTHEQHEHDHEHVHEAQSSIKESDAIGTMTWQQYWIGDSHLQSALRNSIIATLIVGLAPILCVLIVPSRGPILRILLAFAAGGLIGDVFLHLLPHGLEAYSDAHSHDTHSHGHSHDSHTSHNHDSHHGHSHNAGHSIFGMHIIIGLVIFFILEKIFHETGGHSHSHSESDPHSNGDCAVSDTTTEKEARRNAVTVLSILADFTHNFTDGMALTASFLVSDRIGIIQTIAVLLHEVPHEIGDYAILIENGVSKKRAVLVQIITAIGCLLGAILAFVVDQSEIGSDWIVPFTAGGFLYIACVQVLPTLVESKFGFVHSLFHLIGFMAGVGFMVLIGWIEENTDVLSQWLTLLESNKVDL